MRGYTTGDVASLTGLTVRQAQEYGRSGVLDADRDDANRYLFSFRDLVLLRTARALLDARVPQKRILRALRKLKEQLPSGRSLTELRIAADGDEVVVHDNGRAWEPDSGQLRLTFDVGELAARVEPLRGAEHVAGPRVDAAEEWLELGLQLEGRAPAQARRAYERVLELEPGHADALVNLGRLLQETGELDEAARLYERALDATGGDHSTAAYNLGIVLEDLGRMADAAGAYRRALAVDPAFADAHFNLSRVLEQQGDKVSALRHLKTYRSLTR